MRGLLVVAAVAGCGSAPAPAPVVVGNEVAKPRPKPEVDPRGSVDAMVKATLDRMSAGDLDGLIALADPVDQFEHAFSCPLGTKMFDADKERDRARGKVKGAADAKGMAIELVEIVRDTYDTSTLVAAGQKVEDCTTKADIRATVVKVRIRAGVAGEAPSEREIRLELLAAGNRWYLDRAPRLSRNEYRDFFKKYEEHADRVCACRDASCVAAANSDYAKWNAAWAAAHPSPEVPNEEDLKRATQIEDRISACAAKLPVRP